MAALGLMCMLRPASGELAQARLHRQVQHAPKSCRGCTGVLGAESPRHNPFEKDHGRPHCTNRGRGKTWCGQKEFHPRWRGASTDRDVRNSPHTKSLTPISCPIILHQRLPGTENPHLRITAAHAREITFSNQRALSLQQSQQRDVTPTKSFRTTSLIPKGLDLPKPNAMTPLDMIAPALAGFLCSLQRKQGPFILGTHDVAITTFRPNYAEAPLVPHRQHYIGLSLSLENYSPWELALERQTDKRQHDATIQSSSLHVPKHFKAKVFRSPP